MSAVIWQFTSAGIKFGHPQGAISSHVRILFKEPFLTVRDIFPSEKIFILFVIIVNDDCRWTSINAWREGNIIALLLSQQRETFCLIVIDNIDKGLRIYLWGLY